MDFLSKGKVIIISLLLFLLISVFCVPTSADVRVATSSKVFFEKNGEPYNDSVSLKVTCYGYIVDNSDPNRKNYWRGNYVRREPGTYNQTEVFSYSATVDHYGDEIFEPFYLNYRVIDYCTLCGETAGKKFCIDNVGGTPVLNCSMRKFGIEFEQDSDVCHLSTDESKACYGNQSELQAQEMELCDQYLEKFDKKKLYPADTRTLEIGGVTMVITPQYDACYEKAGSIDLNCTGYTKEVACEDYCDPEGNPIQRDCAFYFEIPAYENGTIIGTTIGTDTELPVVYCGHDIVYRYNIWNLNNPWEGFELFL